MTIIWLLSDNNMVVKLCIHIHTASESDDKIRLLNDICYIVKSETKIPNAHILQKPENIPTHKKEVNLFCENQRFSVLHCTTNLLPFLIT